jgi:hypothetical protein
MDAVRRFRSLSLRALAAACIGVQPAWADEDSPGRESVPAPAVESATVAQVAIAADAVSTAAALSTKAVEMNPAGWATVPIRLAITEYARKLPAHESKPITDAVGAAGWGAAANNALVALGAGPGALLVGALVTLTIWRQGADEREFLRLCQVHRVISKNPRLTCTFKSS